MKLIFDDALINSILNVVLSYFVNYVMDNDQNFMRPFTKFKLLYLGEQKKKKKKRCLYKFLINKFTVLYDFHFDF